MPAPEPTVAERDPAALDRPAPAVAVPRSRPIRLLDRVRRSSLAPLVLLWIALLLWFSLAEPRFMTGANLRNMLEEYSVIFVVAVAQTAIVVMGAIDLSAGGLLALSGLVLTVGNHGVPPWAAVLLTILFAGVLGGLLNGIPIGRLRMNPFVVTLGTAAIFRGIAEVSTNGATRVLDDPGLVGTLASGSVGPIPVAVLVMAAVFAAYWLVLRYTYPGRDVYAIGNNEEAAVLAGVPVTRIKVGAFVALGLVVGLAAVLSAGRLASVAPSSGVGLELTAIAAVLLGGTSLAGGRGSVVGTMVAVLFLATLDNGLRISGVSAFWREIVTGSVLVLAVGFDQLRERVLAERNRREQPWQPVSAE